MRMNGIECLPAALKQSQPSARKCCRVRPAQNTWSRRRRACIIVDMREAARCRAHRRVMVNVHASTWAATGLPGSSATVADRHGIHPAFTIEIVEHTPAWTASSGRSSRPQTLRGWRSHRDRRVGLGTLQLSDDSGYQAAVPEDRPLFGTRHTDGTPPRRPRLPSRNWAGSRRPSVGEGVKMCRLESLRTSAASWQGNLAGAR